MYAKKVFHAYTQRLMAVANSQYAYGIFVKGKNMTSDNKTVMKAIDLLIMKREKLRDKKQNLRDKIDDKYPFEIYGLKGDQIYEDKSKELDDEIKLLSTYISGMYDLIEIIEGKSG